MKFDTFVGAILSKNSGLMICQLKFIPLVVRLFLIIRGRVIYLNLERYCDYCEQSFLLHYEKSFNFKSYNTALIDTCCMHELILIFDARYLAKSGKHTP